MDQDNSRNKLESLAKDVNIPERQESSVQNPTQTKTPAKGMKKKWFYVLIAALLLLILFVIVLAVALAGRGDTGDDDVTPTPEVTSTPEVTPTPEVAEEGRIAYILDGNVYVVNADGTGKYQVTTDGSLSDYYYQSVSWAGEGVVGYSKCDDTACIIYTFDLDSEVEELVTEVDAMQLLAAAWSPDGVLVYMSVLDSGEREVVIFDGSENVVKTFPEALGRGGSLNDSVGFRFTTDGEYFAAVYTFGAADEDSVTVFDMDGTEIGALALTDAYPSATFPFFYDGSLYFKNAATIVSTDYAIASQTIVDNSFSGYDLYVNESGEVVYWTEDGAGATETFIWSIEDDTTTSVAENLAFAKWLDSDSLVGEPTEPADGMLPFEMVGLARIETDGTGFQILDSGVVIDFAIKK